MLLVQNHLHQFQPSQKTRKRQRTPKPKKKKKRQQPKSSHHQNLKKRNPFLLLRLLPFHPLQSFIQLRTHPLDYRRNQSLVRVVIPTNRIRVLRTTAMTTKMTNPDLEDFLLLLLQQKFEQHLLHHRLTLVYLHNEARQPKVRILIQFRIPVREEIALQTPLLILFLFSRFRFGAIVRRTSFDKIAWKTTISSRKISSTKILITFSLDIFPLNNKSKFFVFAAKKKEIFFFLLFRMSFNPENLQLVHRKSSPLTCDILVELRHSGEYSDVILRTDDQQLFSVHRAILSCELFHHRLSSFDPHLSL